MPIETLPGAVGGFRIMKLQPEGVGPPRMLSIGGQLSGSDFEWKAKEKNVMVCGKQNEHRGQRPPVWGCRCGFWFYKKLEDLQRFVPPSQYGIDEGVWCLVGGWGKIVEHEIGVRTQYARPLALIDIRPPHPSPRLTDVRWRKWIDKIGLPVIGAHPDEINVTAAMLEIEMLEYTEPPKLAQVISPSGALYFVDASKTIYDQMMPEGGAALPNAHQAFILGESATEFGFALVAQRYTDEHGDHQHFWENLDADRDTMMHNHAQVERALRSPYAALHQA
jgi:hypothetical protein